MQHLLKNKILRLEQPLHIVNEAPALKLITNMRESTLSITYSVLDFKQIGHLRKATLK